MNLYALLMLATCMLCNGQNKIEPASNITPVAKAIASTDGPDAMVRAVTQDSKGNIWLATSSGVFRYDGKSFANITSNVSSARFFSVLEDRKGNFWFASIGSGVYYYDGKSFRNFTTKEGLADNEVTNIYEDKAGNIWFSTQKGASRYDGQTFRNYKMDEEAANDRDDNGINSIIEDKSGKFWFGTRRNTYVYDGVAFKKFTNKGENFVNVRSVIEDRKGNIWLGGNDGLWRYDGQTFTNFAQNFVGVILEDSKGNIWTSAENPNDAGWVKNWALFRYDEKSLSDKKPVVTKIEADKIMTFGILEATDGSIWYGSVDGVYRYDGNTIKDFKAKNRQ